LAAGTRTTVTEPLTLVRPHLWNGRSDPYFYQAVAQVIDGATGLVVDSVTQPLGLRTVTIDSDTGLFLNGEHFQVHAWM
jgi:beta-galactosidase